MKSALSDKINCLRRINVNILFLAFLLAFILDLVVNYFVDVPVFVMFALLALPLLVLQTSFTSENKKWMIILCIPFILFTIINNLVYSFHVRNVSDLLFILLFFTFYLLYSSNKDTFSTKWLHILAVAIIILFSFTFIGINNVSPILSKTVTNNYIGSTGQSSTNDKFSTNKDFADQKEGISKRESFLKSLANPDLDYLESEREYNRGMFRIPQVASYFFGFLTLFYLYFFWNRNKILSLTIVAALLFIVLYTGTRIFPYTIIMLTIIWFMLKPRRWPFLVVSCGLVALLFIYRYKIMLLTQDTFLYQYFTFFATAADNLPRLSRVILWNSWLKEIAEFGIFDILVGKSFYGSLIANAENVYILEWFHNDFLSIFFSYGVICFALYSLFFLKIYIDNKTLINRNFFVFAIFASMPLMAFLNGFYYYFPVFLLYIFFIIIKSEQSKIIHHENWDIRNQGNPQPLRWI